MGNFNTHETERIALEKHRIELEDKREKERIVLTLELENKRLELEDKRLEFENKRLELEDKRLELEDKREKDRIERELPSYADHPLYSVNLAKWTGLRAPYEQWTFTGTSVAIVWRGVPHIQRGYWAYQLERAIHVGDNLRRGKLLEKLKLTQAEIEIPTEKLNKTIMETKDKAAKWGALCVLTGCYVAKAKYMQEMYTASKRNK
eukprot:gene36393-44145_t